MVIASTYYGLREPFKNLGGVGTRAKTCSYFKVTYRSENDLQGYRFLVSWSLGSNGSGTDIKGL